MTIKERITVGMPKTTRTIAQSGASSRSELKTKRIESAYPINKANNSMTGTIINLFMYSFNT